MPTDGDHEELHSASSIQPPAPAYIPQVLSHNFPLPSAMNRRGDVAGNWSFSADDLFSYSVMPSLADYPLAILFQTVFSRTIDYCCEAISPCNTLIQATYATFLG